MALGPIIDDNGQYFEHPAPPREGPVGHEWDPIYGTWYATQDLPGTATPTPAPPGPTPAPGPAPGPGTTPGGSLGDLAAYGGPMRPDYGFYTPAPGFDFDYPDFSYESFHAPSPEDAANDPGYQFAMREGRQALEASASGKGALRTGGTLKDILSWGQGLAAQQYGNVFDRSLTTYTTNRGNAFENYTTNRGNRYQVARDKYAPTLLDWQTRMEMGQRAADLEFQRAWDDHTWRTPNANTIVTAGSQ
jgi:hypothetical protein